MPARVRGTSALVGARARARYLGRAIGRLRLPDGIERLAALFELLLLLLPRLGLLKQHLLVARRQPARCVRLEEEVPARVGVAAREAQLSGR